MKNFKVKHLILIMLGFFATGFLLMSFHVLGLFILGMILTAFGQSTLGVAMTSEIMGEVDVKERGEAVGVLSAIASAATILAPIGSGLAFQFMPNFPYILASILSITTLVIMRMAHVSEQHCPESDELAKEVII